MQNGRCQNVPCLFTHQTQQQTKTSRPDGRLFVGGSADINAVRPKLARLVARNVPLPANPPVIISDLDPCPITAAGGDTVTLQVSAAAGTPITTTWSAQSAPPGSGFPLPSSDKTDDTTLTIPAIRATATYYATVRNAAGSVVSPAIVVNVTPRAPAFTAASVSVSASPGREAVFHASFAGSGPLTYQWFVNGTATRDPPNAGVDPIACFTSADPRTVGTHQLVIRNALGTATATFTLTIDPSARVANVATRGLFAASLCLIALNQPGVFGRCAMITFEQSGPRPHMLEVWSAHHPPVLSP